GGSALISAICFVLRVDGSAAVGVPAGTGTPSCCDHHAAFSTDTDRADGFTSVVRARRISASRALRRMSSARAGMGSPSSVAWWWKVRGRERGGSAGPDGVFSLALARPDPEHAAEPLGRDALGERRGHVLAQVPVQRCPWMRLGGPFGQSFSRF